MLLCPNGSYTILNLFCKVEKILKGSLNLIPSPSSSVKIQVVNSKVCFRCKGKTWLGVVNFWKQKRFVDIIQQCFALLLQVTFPANNFNYHWRWWYQIQALFNKCFLLSSTLLKIFEKHIFFQSFSRSAQPQKASSREISNTTLPFLIQPMLETPLTMFQRMSWQNTDALLTLRIEDQATVSFLKSYNEIQCFF